MATPSLQDQNVIDQGSPTTGSAEDRLTVAASVFFVRAATATAEPDSKALKVTFSSAHPVKRYGYDRQLGIEGEFEEVLSQSRSDWNLERLSAGVLPFLDNHDQRSRLGKVKSVTFAGEMGTASIVLRNTAAAQELREDLANDTAPGISFGYRVGKYEVITPAKYKTDENGYRIVVTPPRLLGKKIDLLEISTANIPADPHVGFKSEAVNFRSLEIEGDAWGTTSAPLNSTKPKRKPRKPMTTYLERAAEIELPDEIRSDVESILSDAQTELASLKKEVSGLTAERAESQKAQATLEERMAAIELRAEIGNAYHTLRRKAEGLVAEAKLSAAEFKADFSADPSADIAALIERSEGETRQELAVIVKYLARCESRQPMLNTRQQVNETVGDRTVQATAPGGQSVDDYAASLIKSLGATGI